MSKVGKGIEKGLRSVRDAVLGGKPDIDLSQLSQETKDTAQEEADKSQGTANAAIARRKKRSLLASVMNDGVNSGVTQQAKKLLGE